jgi:hypothetical protein
LLRAARALSVIAIAGWLGSLVLPALSFRFDSERDQVLFGYQVLTSGYFHLIVLEFSWLANFAFWFVVPAIWTRPERRRWLYLGAIVTLLLTAQSVEIFIWDRFFEYPRPYAGYFVWIASNVLVSIGALTVAGFSDSWPRAEIEGKRGTWGN